MKMLVDIYTNLSYKIEKASYITPILAQREIYKYTLGKEKHCKGIKKEVRSSSEFIEVTKEKYDVLIVDESHRLKQKSGIYNNKGENQTKEIINASKFSIFFIDDLQRITLKDEGSTEEIMKIAKKQHAIIEQFELTSQFRCFGSTEYISWVEDVLQMRNRQNRDEIDFELNYDVKIVDDPNEVRNFIKKKNKKNNNARIVAGCCWDSKEEARNAPQIYDIEIEKYNFRMSWNLKKEKWAIAEDSVERAGCVYTCQGLDFEYIGVIIGKDMIYRNGKVEGDYKERAKTDHALYGIQKIMKENKEKGENLVDEIIKNTYRILLTRGKCRLHYILRR